MDLDTSEDSFEIVWIFLFEMKQVYRLSRSLACSLSLSLALALFLSLSHLSMAAPQDNVYPKCASVQFYKMFLDPAVRRELVEYHALALIEWDVIVAHETR